MFGVSAGVRGPGSSVSILIWRRIARSGVRISVKEIDFSPPRAFQSLPLGPPPKPLFSRYSPSFPRAKRPERDVGQSRLSRDEVKNEWSHTWTPRICVHAMDMGLLYLFHHKTLWPVMWRGCAEGIVGHVPGRRPVTGACFLVTFVQDWEWPLVNHDHQIVFVRQQIADFYHLQILRMPLGPTQPPAQPISGVMQSGHAAVPPAPYAFTVWCGA